MQLVITCTNGSESLMLSCTYWSFGSTRARCTLGSNWTYRGPTRPELAAPMGRSRLCFLAPTDLAGRPELVAPAGRIWFRLRPSAPAAPTGRNRFRLARTRLRVGSWNESYDLTLVNMFTTTNFQVWWNLLILQKKVCRICLPMEQQTLPGHKPIKDHSKNDLFREFDFFWFHFFIKFWSKHMIKFTSNCNINV